MGNYKYKLGQHSQLSNVKSKGEGEPLELKIERIVSNKEPISDGAPEIFTERKDGVVSAYNIRTDRWEIAATAMDHVSGSIDAKRDAKAKNKEDLETLKKDNEEKGKVVKLDVKETPKDSGAKPTLGTKENKG